MTADDKRRIVAALNRRYLVEMSVASELTTWERLAAEVDAMTDNNTFTCEQCGGTFVLGRPDEEAQAEAVALFGKRGDDPEMALVCEDCFREIMAALE